MAMEKYFVFSNMLEFMANHAEVVDADMNRYNGSMMIVGEADGQVITIEVTIENKEAKKNA
jgi:hypothetical protein